MLLLGIDTSTTRSSVALATADGVVSSAALTRANAHGGFLSPAIAFCMEQAQRTMDDLTGVAVTIGPGLFTGMRVGIATAQALANALSLPVVGLPSLDALAYPLRHRGTRLCTVLDAKRRELFWAYYDTSANGVARSGEFRVGSADELAAELEGAGQPVLCAGDGARAKAELLLHAGAQVVDEVAFDYPDATNLLALALPRFLSGDTQMPQELQPLYLRGADARIGWDQRGVLAGGNKPAAVEG